MEAVDAALAGLVALVHAGGVLAALNAAARARTAQGAVAWAVSLVLLPWLSLPLYAVFGPPDNARIARGHRAARRAALDRIDQVAMARAAEAAGADPRRVPLERLAPLPTVAAPRPRLLVDGEAAFAAMFAAIEAAERHVLVQFYIVRDDGLGGRLADLLARKAREGVRVLFLYDRVGCHRTPRRYWQRLEAAGVEVRPFEIDRRLRRILRLNFRNHRKIVAADGRVAIVGGPNAGDEYLGLSKRFGPWRDTSVEVRGPPAAAVEASFAEDWMWTGGEPLAAVPTAPEAGQGGGPAVPVLVVPTGPADDRPAGTLLLGQLIAEARERLWIASPYFVPDLDVMTMLRLARLRGVDVRILIPDRPDHLIVWLAAFAYVDEADDAGIALWRYERGFMHQKVWLVDDWAASVGTANLDSRSLRLNFEITALTFDRAFAREVAAMLEADFARSRRYDRAAHARRPLGIRVLAPAARLASPLL